MGNDTIGGGRTRCRDADRGCTEANRVEHFGGENGTGVWLRPTSPPRQSQGKAGKARKSQAKPGKARQSQHWGAKTDKTHVKAVDFGVAWGLGMVCCWRRRCSHSQMPWGPKAKVLE